jgi:hypothetical protein
MTGNGVLTIFHTKMKQVFEREIGTLVLFYKARHSSPPFSFLKPWLTDSIGCPSTFTYHGGVPFFFYFFYFWNKTIWKIANPTTTSPWAKNSVTKRELFWRFFLKGSTWKFTWNGLQIPCIGIYSGHIDKLGFGELGARVELILITKWGLAKDWERPTKRAITAIIMHSDKISLRRSIKWHHKSKTKWS